MKSVKNQVNWQVTSACWYQVGDQVWDQLVGQEGLFPVPNQVWKKLNEVS